MDFEKELQLIEKSKEDIHYFDEVYRYYFPKIFGYCLNRLANKELAEDITSEVFLKVTRDLSKYKLQENIRFGSWLYRVAHNLIIDFYRKNKKYHYVSSNEDDEIIDEKTNTEKQAYITESQKMIAEVMKKLKPRYQEVISLKYFMERDNEEIAEILGMTKSNVALLTHRALKSFRDKYNKNFPGIEIFDMT
ncbi:MAG: sigma-70 family RNA polymerase sigma factor [bacterium]